MNLEELRRIRERERATDSLQALREEFYSEVGAYLRELRQERDDIAADVSDPFQDPDVQSINDELATSERTVEALYERRVGKIVKLASFAAADMSAERDGLTAEEQDLFDDIVATIKQNRSRVLTSLSTDGTADTAETRSSSDPDMPRGESDDSDRNDPEPQPSNDVGSDADEAIDRTTVRIIEDIGEIFGVDEQSYDLSADDIVTLPTQNAEPLLDREVAERVE